jgi:ParB family chromosome partitioning protein
VTYVAVTLARGGHDPRRAMESGHPSACELLGMAPVGSVYTGRANPITEAAATAATPRATMLALAVLLGAAEDATDRRTWRNPTSDHRAYFTALSKWGYPLSTVEQLVLADPEGPHPDAADDPALDAGSDSAGGDELADPETLMTD